MIVSNACLKSINNEPFILLEFIELSQYSREREREEREERERERERERRGVGRERETGIY